MKAGPYREDYILMASRPPQEMPVSHAWHGTISTALFVARRWRDFTFKMSPGRTLLDAPMDDFFMPLTARRRLWPTLGFGFSQPAFSWHGRAIVVTIPAGGLQAAMAFTSILATVACAAKRRRRRRKKAGCEKAREGRWRTRRAGLRAARRRTSRRAGKARAAPSSHCSSGEGWRGGDFTPHTPRR